MTVIWCLPSCEPPLALDNVMAGKLLFWLVNIPIIVVSPVTSSVKPGAVPAPALIVTVFWPLTIRLPVETCVKLTWEVIFRPLPVEGTVKVFTPVNSQPVVNSSSTSPPLLTSIVALLEESGPTATLLGFSTLRTPEIVSVLPDGTIALNFWAILSYVIVVVSNSIFKVPEFEIFKLFSTFKLLSTLAIVVTPEIVAMTFAPSVRTASVVCPVLGTIIHGSWLPEFLLIWRLAVTMSLKRAPLL